MGGRIRTRIAVFILVLLALSAASSCYVIALNAQAAVEAATRARLVVLAGFLRDTVERNVRLGASLRGPASLQGVLDAAVARDPDIDMVSVLGRNGTVLLSAGRGETGGLLSPAMAASAPPPEAPEIRQTPDGIVIRVGLKLDPNSPLSEIVIKVPNDRLAPDVERLIALLLRGALILVLVLAPVILAGAWLMLHPATRSIGIVASALRAIGQGEQPRFPNALAGRGDPYWDHADPGELASLQVRMIECLQAARGGYREAERLLGDLERRVILLDTEGPAALAKAESSGRSRSASDAASGTDAAMAADRTS
ncbi:hypothetical protein ACFOGJ_24430 [Marinibaculum pumilum]|uniref:HAMP domain-containing protein n=1 Tax=Marinibaculum pumilum TaxID=1766165 RepID=A0ABV7L6Y8_9PROT